MRLTDGRAIDFTPKMTRNTLGGGANIDDDHILTTSTWSSYKINSMIVNNGEKANTTTLANAYTSGTSYSVGDYCSHDGNVYRCKSTISSAPATFDPSKWDIVVLMESFATAAQIQQIISGYSPA